MLLSRLLTSCQEDKDFTNLMHKLTKLVLDLLMKYFLCSGKVRTQEPMAFVLFFRMEEVLLRVYLEFWQDVNVESVCLTPLGVSPVHVVAAR